MFNSPKPGFYVSTKYALEEVTDDRMHQIMLTQRLNYMTSRLRAALFYFSITPSAHNNAWWVEGMLMELVFFLPFYFF